MALLKIENLSFSYALGNTCSLENISLEINDGEFVLLMGKSASGKSTLLRMIKKELTPNGEMTGSITCNAKNVGFVMQNTDSSFVSENVISELAFPLENKAYTNEKIALKTGELASYLNISDKLDCSIDKLSGGERAVIAIASAIIDGAELLLLDEPFSQLDPKSVSTVTALLKRLNEELGVTIILSSHSSAEVIDLSDRLVVLEEGKIISDCTITESLKNDALLPFFPAFTSLFDERPLTVKQAMKYAERLSQKPEKEQKKADKAIEVKHLTFAYGKRERDILASLDFTAYKGKINCIIGANGSGKTTLLKAMAKIKKAYSGKLTLNGSTCYMPQNVKHLFSADRVCDEVTRETAQKLGLDKLLERHPYDLSGGQAQLLAMGILLEQNTDILLLDEPTRALDCFAKKELMSLLRSLADEGKTVVIVTHDLELVGEYADYVSFLSDGVIAMTGTARQVLSSLDFYTSSIRRITRKHLENAVSVEDLV